MKINKTDVLIIGGVPAGTTFGNLMKKRGFDITLLEEVLGLGPEAWLCGNRRSYQKAGKEYQRKIRTGIAGFCWSIYRFTTPFMRNLMSKSFAFRKAWLASVRSEAGLCL